MQFDVNGKPLAARWSWRWKVTGDCDRTTEYAENMRRRDIFRMFWNSITARDEVSSREQFIKRDIFSCISLPATRPAYRGMPPLVPAGSCRRRIAGSLGPRWIRAKRGRFVKQKGTEVTAVSRRTNYRSRLFVLVISASVFLRNVVGKTVM